MSKQTLETRIQQVLDVDLDDRTRAQALAGLAAASPAAVMKIRDELPHTELPNAAAVRSWSSDRRLLHMMACPTTALLDGLAPRETPPEDIAATIASLEILSKRAIWLGWELLDALLPHLGDERKGNDGKRIWVRALALHAGWMQSLSRSKDNTVQGRLRTHFEGALPALANAASHREFNRDPIEPYLLLWLSSSLGSASELAELFSAYLESGTPDQLIGAVYAIARLMELAPEDDDVLALFQTARTALLEHLREHPPENEQGRAHRAIYSLFPERVDRLLEARVLPMLELPAGADELNSLMREQRLNYHQISMRVGFNPIVLALTENGREEHGMTDAHFLTALRLAHPLLDWYPRAAPLMEPFIRPLLSDTREFSPGVTNNPEFVSTTAQWVYLHIQKKLKSIGWTEISQTRYDTLIAQFVETAAEICRVALPGYELMRSFKERIPQKQHAAFGKALLTAALDLAGRPRFYMLQSVLYIDGKAKSSVVQESLELLSVSSEDIGVRAWLERSAPAAVHMAVENGEIERTLFPDVEVLFWVPYEERGQPFGYELNSNVIKHFSTLLMPAQTLEVLRAADESAPGPLLAALYLAQPMAEAHPGLCSEFIEAVEPLLDSGAVHSWSYWPRGTYTHRLEVAEVALEVSLALTNA